MTEAAPNLPATISILVTRDNQRLGDLAAGTVVTRERPVVEDCLELLARAKASRE